MIGTVIAAVGGLFAVLGLVFYLVRWTKSVTDSIVKRTDSSATKRRDMASRIRGLETAVASRDRTIDTLGDDKRRAEAAAKAATEDYYEILQTLADGGDAVGTVALVNAALERLQKLSDAPADETDTAGEAD